MRPESSAHLWDAANAARLVVEFVRGTSQADFLENRLVRSAVERQLQILGDALKRVRDVDSGAAARIPDIDKIVGMRNIIVHEYGNVDDAIVWVAATTRVPALVETLDDLLQESVPPQATGET